VLETATDLLAHAPDQRGMSPVTWTRLQRTPLKTEGETPDTPATSRSASNHDENELLGRVVAHVESVVARHLASEDAWQRGLEAVRESIAQVLELTSRSSASVAELCALLEVVLDLPWCRSGPADRCHRV
jgi:hypothetical protein